MPRLCFDGKMNWKTGLVVIFGGLGWLLVGPSPALAQSLSPERARQLQIDFDATRQCPNCNHQIPRARIYGWRGQPWYDRESGGCRCGKHSGITQYNVSSHWPSPFSVLIDHGRQGTHWKKTTDTTRPRFRDHLDVLAGLRLLPPVRCDNGYTGPDCDPWGLPGRSRQGVVVDESAPALEPQNLPAGSFAASMPKLNANGRQASLMNMGLAPRHPGPLLWTTPRPHARYR
jgi:hypothetical protein